MGAMGNFESGWHVHIPGRTRLDPNRTARVELGMSARHLPIGAMGTFQALLHAHAVVDRSVRSCASMSRGQARQQFSHRGDGNF